MRTAELSRVRNLQVNRELTCPGSSNFHPGQANSPAGMLRKLNHPVRNQGNRIPGGAAERFRFHAEIASYIPEENSMAFVFPET